MTVFEGICLNRELLWRLREAGARMDDVRHVELYREYLRLLRQREKKTYIVEHLSEKYGVCVRKVYGIIKLFGTRCTDCAP